MKAIMLCMLVFPFALSAQVGIKTNILYWGTSTPNISAEITALPRLTFEVTGSINPWNFSEGDKLRKVQHWVVSGGARYWLAEKFDGHFLGTNLIFGSYNAGGTKLPFGIFPALKDNRYEGYGTGIGFSYGYQCYLSPHWNLEATAGMGYLYMNYSKQECYKCGTKFGRNTRHYVGPTRIGVSLVYLIKSRRY